MSMPKIPEEPYRPTKEEVVIDLLKSIAMEETAISHLLNAEAEKIQAFVGKCLDFPTSPTTREIIKFEGQVFKLVDIIVMKEWLLLRKLENVIEFDCMEPCCECEE
ncbi:hypothetical protein N0M98_09690 [Paenibacillus doosanensis]|uniref:hypothetical protein n=1 Tax=Paenibacillus doosanensis TaxID=1229154 RepID=UPI00217F3D4B|nr:hypothetical protein [Paenibacillus doosanensis]MCS7460413.1 hypothetical protein [Paenibacillus doosanensis]